MVQNRINRLIIQLLLVVLMVEEDTEKKLAEEIIDEFLAKNVKVLILDDEVINRLELGIDSGVGNVSIESDMPRS